MSIVDHDLGVLCGAEASSTSTFSGLRRDTHRAKIKIIRAMEKTIMTMMTMIHMMGTGIVIDLSDSPEFEDESV
jgi:hypothetical protein